MKNKIYTLLLSLLAISCSTDRYNPYMDTSDGKVIITVRNNKNFELDYFKVGDETFHVKNNETKILPYKDSLTLEVFYKISYYKSQRCEIDTVYSKNDTTLVHKIIGEDWVTENCSKEIKYKKGTSNLYFPESL